MTKPKERMDIDHKKIKKFEKKISLLKNENVKLKEYNKELLKDNELIDALMENIPDQIFFKDRKCCFTFANKSCFDKFNLKSPTDIIGKTDLDFFSKKFARKWMEEEKQIMKTEKPVIGKEELEIWPDGRETWTHMTKMPFYGDRGEIIGIFGVSRDITKLKQTEQQLQALMDNIPDSIYFKDKESRLVRINKSCAMKHKLDDPAHAIGKTDFDLFPKEFAQKEMAAEKKIIRTGKPIISGEHREPLKGEPERWISSTKMPLRNYKGEIIGTFGVSRDITKLKQAEKALQVSKEKLEKKVQRRTSELRLANEGMRIRIQQLNYLNRKAHFFAQLIDRETLLSAIFYAFVERFPDGEVHLCERRNEAFMTVFNTENLGKNGNLGACIKALDYVEVDEDEGNFFEVCWMENSILKDIFNESLKKLPCYIEIPLITDKKLRGIVQVFAPKYFKDIYEQENTVLNTLASHAASSLDNANNYIELKEKTRLQSELEIARGIQKKFAPKEPIIPEMVIKGVYQPAKEVGGDYLDYFQNKDGNWVIIVADVCGKGVPAALVMTSLRGIVRAMALKQNSSKKLLSSVNSIIAPDLRKDNSFITCLAVIVDNKAKTMNFTRAGHPMLISYGNKKIPKTIESEGIALGLIIGDKFEDILEEVTINVKKGDKFIGYTDGLDEAMNKEKVTFGTDRLLALIKRNRSKKPDDLIYAILKEVKGFCEGQPPSDDLTFFVMERR